MSKFIRNRSLLRGGRGRLEWMGESLLQILLILFLNILPSLWLFSQQELDFPPPSPPRTLPNSLLALTKNLTNISFKILVNAHLKLLVCGHIWIPRWNYRTIPKISPSTYKPPQKLIPETPTRSASDPISGLTALCAYLFYSYLFLSQFTIIFPEKTTRMPP